jgi:hypothetical protein
MKTLLTSHEFSPTKVERRGSAFRSCRSGTCYWICLAVLITALYPAQAQEPNEIGQEEKGKKKVFSFEGGNPFDFVVALDKHFRTRLVQILTLPETLSRTRVPKLRVAAEDPREVLNLYNRLESPTLGRWRFEPPQHAPGTNMNVLMLVPDKNAAAAATTERSIKVKGIGLAGVPEAKWEALIRDIDQAKAYGQDAALIAAQRQPERGVDDAFGGSTRVQRDSKVLIVAGSDAYLEMVDSLVSAHRQNAEIEAKKAVSYVP